MRDNSYRVLITVIAIWGALHIPTMVINLSFQPQTINEARFYLAPVALAIAPIAVIGICRVQGWGFIAMAMSLVLALLSYQPLAFFPGVILLFAALRYWLSRYERKPPELNAEPIIAPDGGKHSA